MRVPGERGRHLSRAGGRTAKPVVQLPMDNPEVVWSEERGRYELRRDGETLGFADVLRRGNEWVFPHVEVNPAHEGQGLGSRLVRGALEDAKRQGAQVVPLCPFVVAYLRRHPELM